MTTARIDEAAETLIIAGEGQRPASAELIGPRARVDARITGGGKTWKATFPLRASRWGGAELPLPTGDYEIAVADAELDDLSVAPQVLTGVRVAVRGSVARIAAPVDPAYETAEGQSTLEGRYVAHPGATENAVFFESFYGRTVGCNPQAIDRALAAQAPDVVRYWSVVDLSVAVPEGAVAVVEGSPEWWRARAASRLLVVNDWLRRRFARKPGQRVLQTWHGTPLKRLALHRPGFDPRRMAAVVKESRRWDVLLAQNTYSERILRKAYAFFGRPIWVEGYPRNDALVTGDAASIRAALGIEQGERVLLYAPTWRDDRTEMVDFVDPEELARQTDAVVLVRGHSRTIDTGRDRAGARVIDVTGYPETSQLLLAADALITDYSSVMFDFSVTGKPMYFLVPDLDHYRGQLRGFYFDLASRAPGPLVGSQKELVDALADPEHEKTFGARYMAWRAQFNSRDDGHAAERVVARILDQGYVTR
ncbi:CDP-glycerol glycerophosphotransferase family protein [Microbacterium hydrocarbonoxydans]|uniref:CDP-glycerol glycerophosphotransferase, TagB/SpsB family n=1 Tax=Microbacterium hydrocarbonoxydans TaxID=273678 RepID=A0A1H4NQL8_9MICO|nr:CDP-glycerol glycerophosphotransferase family protein [Microbacterium hydrocarbonoxydans]SEB96932.1 CDP-glycerol glycerophosphotransferase, TagB/SpsB family [Microbacterium hydrocarbonoxydans]